MDLCITSSEPRAGLIAAYLLVEIQVVRTRSGDKMWGWGSFHIVHRTILVTYSIDPDFETKLATEGQLKAQNETELIIDISRDPRVFA